MARRRVPFVPQMEAVECGAASLASILAYWGHHAPLPEVREACKVSRDGANAASMLEAARSYGLEAEAVKVEVEHLEDLPLPAILHWEFKHFLVLERLTKKGAWIVDPGGGRRHVGAGELATAFTGVALCFAPDDERFRPRAARRPSLGRYLDMLRGLRGSLAQVLGASAMLQLAGLVFPVANQLLVDRVLLPRHEPWLWGLALALVGAVLGQALLTLLRSYVLQGLRVALDRALLSGFVGHLVSLPIGFFLQRQSGDLMQRVESNAQVRDLFTSRSLSSILDAFLILGYAALMVAYHAGLAATVLALAALRVSLVALLRRMNEQLMAAELAASGQERAVLVEALSGLETVKASGSQELVLGRWTHRLVRRMNVGTERQRLSAASGQAMVFLQGASAAAVFWFGGREVVAERMTLGVFTAFLTLQGLFLAPLESLLSAVSELQYLGNHLRRLDDVMETPPEATGDRDPGRLQGGVSLEGVGFRYSEGSPWILEDIHLEIRPGEKVAIVGRTGAGKSTLARLLLGMHAPSAGAIRFDGKDLAALDLQALRRQMGVVLQEPFVFDDTVRANLSLLDPEMPLERVKWAARMACVDKVLERLPQGYKTRLGENARILSGGERQRLCLARAIAGEPALLLLDEATSSLDLETEAAVHANLAALGCTRILIAHRLETVKDADRILVLEGGRIAQQGTYGALAAAPGPFRDLILAQEASRG